QPPPPLRWWSMALCGGSSIHRLGGSIWFRKPGRVWFYQPERAIGFSNVLDSSLDMGSITSVLGSGCDGAPVLFDSLLFQVC
ncbi:hypothetical protein A2U01_0053670, partial [Trifolium medium]|nr:hypothetical protein [Trifolium medium]